MLFKMETSNGDPFAEYMWMGEEQDEFDKKVIEELLEEEQIQRDYEDMIAEERYHLSNSLQVPTEVPSQPPGGGAEGSASYQHNGHHGSSGDAADTVMPRAQEEVTPWGGDGSQKSSEVSSDSDSEGGGPQR